MKAHKKGSFEKGHRLREVLGVRRNRFDNMLMCKVSWWPEMIASDTTVQKDETDNSFDLKEQRPQEMTKTF